MKSRVRTTISKKVMGLNLSGEKNIKLQKILSDCGFTFQSIENTMGAEQIGYLCGFNGFKKADVQAENVLSEECLIFTGLDNKDITLLLKEFRNAQLSIDLKAIVTAHNQSWTLKKLVAELAKEHKTMNGGDKNG